MPLTNIMKTGLIFHFFNTNSNAKNKNSAVQFSDKKSNSGLLLPYKASNKIVAAAERIKPKEADFSPFNTSNT